MHFSGESAGENAEFHTDTGPSCEGFQSNCCNKLPINETALFSQLLPDAECATLFADCISLLSCFLIPSQLPITFCPRFWQSNVGVTLQLGSRPGSRNWPFCPGTTVDPPMTFTHTQHLHAQWLKKNSDPLLKWKTNKHHNIKILTCYLYLKPYHLSSILML